MAVCGEVLPRLLAGHGIDTVFGIPGVHTVDLYRGLAGAPHLLRHGISVEGLSEPLKVFEGSAAEGARGFPANVNVAAAVGLAGVGPERTVLEIWETGTRVNDNPVVGFLLEVRAEGREPWQAETRALVSILAIPRIQPGEVLQLEYDPDDPTRIALVLDI